MRKALLSVMVVVCSVLQTNQLQSQTLPSYLPSNGLVAWYPFNGNANDESGNGNHGTVNGATLVVDRNGNTSSAYSFNGISDFIDLQSTNGLNSSQGISMTMWFKWNGPNGINNHQFIYLIAPNPNGGIVVSDNSVLSADVANCNCVNDIGISTSIEQSVWYFVALTYELNTGVLKMYINGVEVGTSQEEMYQYYTTNNDGDRFGNYHFNSHYFLGEIDDAALFNRSLSPSEVYNIYNGTLSVSGCTNTMACNYNASATLDDGSCTFPTQTYLNCDGTCINDTDADGICNELEVALPVNLPANGLVAWYPFNGNANDESGNGNHGVVNGATLTSDRNGNGNSAYLFNGINNNIVSTPNLPASNSPRTISLWTKTNSSSAGLMSAAAYGSGAGGYVIFPAFILNSNGKYYFESGSSSNQLFSESSVSDNNWHQITLTYSGQNTPVRMYVDGMLNASSVNLDLITENSPFVIGSASWADLWFSGSIDDIAIYNRALTQEEITALYTGTSSNNSGGGGSGSTAGTPAASVPAGIPYQAVIRDNAGAALTNTPVTVRFTLHENTTSGTTEYQETQSLTTNTLGLINTQFGAGTATQGTFAGINWSNTTKFIQVEANTGAGYVDLGTQQMMSVPFAIQANKATAIKNAGLPVYADNAAALTGGLVAGEMYRTANGDLKIVF